MLLNNSSELKDCVFIKGLRISSKIKISDVRDYFQERVGECVVQMTSLSKDKDGFFVVLKFKTAAIAESVLERYHGKYIFGNRVALSYWRAPRNRHSRSLRPQKRDWSPEKTELCDGHRNNTRYSRGTNSLTEQSKSREILANEDNSSRCDYQDHSFVKIYDEREKLGRDTECLLEPWEDDNPGEGYSKDNWDYYDFDYAGGSTDLSERKYEGDEDSWYQHSHSAREECEINDSTAYVNEMDSILYKTPYPEADGDSEFCREPYLDRLREECYDLYPEQTVHRTEDDCARKRYSEAEHNSLGSQNNIQGDFLEKFPSYEQTNQWPHWEGLSRGSPPRRTVSDPEAPRDTYDQFLQEKEMTEERYSWNKSTDESSRNTRTSSGERPASDEWVNQSDEGRGYRGVPGKNFGLSDYHSMTDLAMNRSLSPRPQSSRTLLERTCSDNDNNKDGVRRSHSPAANRLTSVFVSHRSSSSELSSDYSRYDSSPRRDIPSYSCNKRRSATTQRAIYNHTTSKRHIHAEQRKKDIKRLSRRREGSLRHSLMLNQQRRHFSSHLRGNIREKGTRHASLERKKRNSSGDFKNSTKSHRSTESCSPPSVSRRKRNHDDDDDEKSKKDVATAKKRRKTNHRPVNQSETSSRKSENTRKVAMKTTNKGKRQSCEKQKRDIAKPTDKESEKSNTRRTDRLLSDLAASLAEDNISLKRPDPSPVVSKECSLKDVVSYKGKGSKGAESPFALSKDDSVNHIKEDTGEASQGNVSVNMDATTVLGVSSLEGNSVEDVEVSKECHDSVKLPRENLLDEKQGTPSAEGILVTVNPSSQDCFLTAGDKDGAFVKDQIERFDNADLSAIEASNNRSDMTFVTQLEEANREDENFHVDMEFSSDDTSPNGVPTGEMFRFPNKFNNTGNCVGKDIVLTDNGSGLLKTEVSEYVVDTICYESDNRKGITGRKTEGKCVFTVSNDEIENRTCTEADGRKNLDRVELSTNDIRRESYERNASHAMDYAERFGADSQNTGTTEHRSENDKKHVRDTVKDAHRVGTNSTDVFSTCSGRVVDHSLLANDLEHVDMEISDEEQLEDTGNSTACFSEEDKGKFHDASTPYSAHSSSTWKSNGCHVLTPRKDESSPYSPSHPTNTSEGDLEHSNPVKQLCYDEESTGRGDISEARKDDNCATSKVRNDSKTITTVSQQVTLGDDSISTTISNKISRLSVLEYTTHLRPLSRTKEANHQAITYGKCVEGHVGITGACVDAVPTNNDVRDTSNPRKTEGSPSRTPEASLNEPSITYSTNSKTVSQSSCLGEPVGKHAKFEERSGCDLMHSERLTVPETKERHVGKTAGHDIRPLLTECFDSHDATLTHTNEAAKGDARDGTCNVNAESEVNSVGRCATAGKRLYAIDPGALDSVDTSTDIDAEVIDSTDYQKGEQHELGGRIAIPSVHNNPLVTDCAPSNCRNTRNKDCNLSTKAMNSPSSIRRDENDNCTFLRSSSVASTEANQIPSRDFEKTVGKAINSNTVERNYREVSSPSIASIREKENSVSKALWPEGQKESHCSYAAGDAKAVSKHVNCGPDKIEMTSDVEGKRPSSSGLSISVYKDSGKQSSLLRNSGKIDIAVNDDKRVENQCHVDNKSIDNTRLGDMNEGVQMPTNLPLPVSGERPRVRVSSIRASRPCKARSKPPKLIIPRKKMAERESHGPGETSKHVSTCAFASTNLELDHGIEGYSPHETDSVAPEEFKGIKADHELSSKSSSSNDAKEGQLWQSDVNPTATKNMSVLLTPLTETVDNTSMENQRGKGVSMDNKWTDKGNKSEWIENKVEQLRKKKEQIEQVYRKDCQTVVSVVKMLVSKDPRLEGVLQNAVRRSLQDMGQRCVQELEREYRPVS